jgi:hypothetical protein
MWTKSWLGEGFSTQSSPTSRLRSPYECTRSTSLRTDTTTKQRTTARLYSQSPQEVPAHTNVSDAFCITVRIVLLHHETASNPTTDQRGCSSVAKLLSPVGMNLG